MFETLRRECFCNSVFKVLTSVCLIHGQASQHLLPRTLSRNKNYKFFIYFLVSSLLSVTLKGCLLVFGNRLLAA